MDQGKGILGARCGLKDMGAIVGGGGEGGGVQEGLPEDRVVGNPFCYCLKIYNREFSQTFW